MRRDRRVTQASTVPVAHFRHGENTPVHSLAGAEIALPYSKAPSGALQVPSSSLRPDAQRFILSAMGEVMHRKFDRGSVCSARKSAPWAVVLWAALFALVSIAGSAKAMQRVDAATLGEGINRSKSVLPSPDGRWMYVIADGTIRPNKLVKIDLSTMEAVGTVDFAPAGEVGDGPLGVIDPSGTYVYVSYSTFTAARIAKVDVTTMQLVATGNLNLWPQSIAIDSLGAYAYIGSDEGWVEKFSLSTMQVVGQLQTGQNFLRSSAMDPSGTNLYLGTYTGPGRVVKVDLATFQWAGTLTFTGGEVGFLSAAVAADGSAAYFGTYTDPSFPPQIAKVDLANFQPAGTLQLDIDALGLRTVALSSDGRHAYFGTTTQPSSILKIDLATLTLADRLRLDGSDASLLSLAAGVGGDYLYVGTSDYPGKLVKVALRDPVPDQLRFDPAHLDFYAVTTATASTRSVTLRNAGTRAATGLVFTAPETGVSVDASACGSALAAGASCTLALTYAPSMVGVLADQWGVGSAEGGTAHLALLGRAVPAARGLSVSPPALEFGAVDIGTTSAPQMLTVTNNGSVTIPHLTMNSTDSQSFVFDDQCPMLMAGESCQIAVRFKPARTTAPVSAGLRLSNSSANAEVNVALAGQGVLRNMAIVPETSQVPFGSVAVGSTGQRSVAWINVGAVALTELSYAISDPAFTVRANWCTWLMGGAQCMVDLQFSPLAAGPASATLTVTTAEGAQSQVQLTGLATGDVSPPSLSFESANVDLGAVGIGTTAWRSIQLRNQGSGFAFVSDISVFPPFRVDGSACMPTIAPNQSCTVRVGFMPTTAGLRLETLMVMTDQGIGAKLGIEGTGSTDAIFRGGFE